MNFEKIFFMGLFCIFFQSFCASHVSPERGFKVFFPGERKTYFFPQIISDQKIRALALLQLSKKRSAAFGGRLSAYGAIREPIHFCNAGCCYRGGAACNEGSSRIKNASDCKIGSSDDFA